MFNLDIHLSFKDKHTGLEMLNDFMVNNLSLHDLNMFREAVDNEREPEFATHLRPSRCCLA